MEKWWNKNFSCSGFYGKRVERVRKTYGKTVAKIWNFYGKAYYLNPSDLQPSSLSCDTFILFYIYTLSPIKKDHSQKNLQHRRIYNER